MGFYTILLSFYIKEHICSRHSSLSLEKLATLSSSQSGYLSLVSFAPGAPPSFQYFWYLHSRLFWEPLLAGVISHSILCAPLRACTAFYDTGNHILLYFYLSLSSYQTACILRVRETPFCLNFQCLAPMWTQCLVYRKTHWKLIMTLLGE